MDKKGSENKAESSPTPVLGVQYEEFDWQKEYAAIIEPCVENVLI